MVTITAIIQENIKLSIPILAPTIPKNLGHLIVSPIPKTRMNNKIKIKPKLTILLLTLTIIIKFKIKILLIIHTQGIIIIVVTLILVIISLHKINLKHIKNMNTKKKENQLIMEQIKSLIK